MKNPRAKESEKAGYVCIDCGEEFFDDTWNSYTDASYLINLESIRQIAIMHCIHTGHSGIKIAGSDAPKISVKLL
jgi:DNA-directed RNA polymerase subunit RPC12/RpoP